MTINDIAKLAGTSKSTVSRVLTNSPNVKESTRQKVLEIINSQKYQPNSIARGLTYGSTKMIALILPDIRNPFYSEVTWFIEQELYKNGYHMLLCCTDNQASKEQELIEMANAFNFTGIFVFSPINENYFRNYSSNRVPIIMLNRYLTTFSGDTLTSDNFQAGYIAARHLINLGHKEIAICYGSRTQSTHRERHEGFLSALKAFSLTLPEKYNFQVDRLDVEQGTIIGQRLLELGDEAPSSIFCTTDLLAMGVMQVLKKAGKRIPEDMSIVGFDDISFSSLEGVDLTTIRQPYDVIAEEAVRMLLTRIESPDAASQRRILDCELIVRSSTAVHQE